MTRTSALKPLCPTPWTVYDKAIRSVLRLDKNVLTTEEVISSNRLDGGTRAHGPLERLNKGKTGLGLMLISEVKEKL